MEIPIPIPIPPIHCPCSFHSLFFYVDELTLFVGAREQAAMAALLDNDVYYINEILAHQGKPAHRTSMEFLIHWADGKISWDRFNILFSQLL